MEEELVLTSTAVTDSPVDTEDTETNLCEMDLKSTSENKIPLRNRDTSIKSSINNELTPVHRVYMIRWLMLVAMIVLNISNGMTWLTYAPVPHLTADFYSVTLEDVDWFSISFFVASLVVGFISIGILDIFGLRTAVWLGAGFNLFGTVLRYISTLHPILCSTHFSKSGFMVAMIGQIFCACAQPFLLYAPAKLANTWFGPKERVLCTNLASVANPIGIAVIQLVSPHVVMETNKLPTLLWICIIPAGLGAVLSISYYRSQPLHPPTISGDTEHLPFFKGLKDALLNWNFLVLVAIFGVAAGMFNALVTIIPQYLCPYGYSNQDVGLWASLLIFCGLIGATLAGLLIDHTKKFQEIGIANYTCAIIFFIWFIEVATIENRPYLVAIPLCLFGFFALPILPVCMELGVEVTYPVAEATSSGILWSSAQITSIIIVTISQVIVTDIDTQYSKCGIGQMTTPNSSDVICPNRNSTSHVNSDSVKAQNWSNAGLLLASMAVFGYVLFALIFRPKYKRLDEENKETKIDHD